MNLALFPSSCPIDEDTNDVFKDDNINSDSRHSSSGGTNSHVSCHTHSNLLQELRAGSTRASRDSCTSEDLGSMFKGQIINVLLRSSLFLPEYEI